MATLKTADVLGLGDVMAKTSVGKFNGQYGIFMEKAHGINMPTFVNNEKVNKGFSPAKEFRCYLTSCRSPATSAYPLSFRFESRLCPAVALAQEDDS